MDETKPILYRCDPLKHKECKKTNCFKRGGECNATTHKEYAGAKMKGAEDGTIHQT